MSSQFYRAKNAGEGDFVVIDPRIPVNGLSALAGADEKPLPPPPMEADLPEVAIAVMGATGTGKSTFINLLSDSNLGVGDGLRSCTEGVQVAGAFNLDGRRVVLIDTPGFDDTVRSDTDVLKTIAAFLATSYEQGYALDGVLYFHRISDFKMGGTSTKNFKMFRKLCGDSALRNAVIVTNMWGEVDPRRGDAREAELAGDDAFFKPVLDKGAQMARHDNTCPSAERIIRLILENHPLPLRIQEELVNERRDISQTGAGEELNQELNSQIRKHQQGMHVLREEMEQAIRDKDEETRKELEVESKRVRREISRFRRDSRRLESDYRKEKETLEERFRQVELEARREADRVAAQYQQQIGELENTLRYSTKVSKKEKARMIDEINELSWRRSIVHKMARRGFGFFSMIGVILSKLVPTH